MRVTRSIVVAFLIAGPALAQAPATQWGPAPPFLPAGARFVLMAGDPSQPGVYTIRLEFPDGYVIPPHFHPTDEYVTVICPTRRLFRAPVAQPVRALAL